MPGPAATVSEILEGRLHPSDRVLGGAAVVAAIVHGGFLLFLTGISKTAPPPVIPPSVRVGVVSPSALVRHETPPAPVEKAKPQIEKPKPDEVKPTEKAMPLPAKKKPEKEKPKPAPAKPAATTAEKRDTPPALDLPSAANAGEPSAASSFGTSVSALDADFPFAYWIDQLLSLIGANWLKPNVPDTTSATVAFRVLRNGQIADVRIETSSGLAFYDRAASRSIFAANPLPPLPPEYKGDALGIHLQFR